MKKQNHKVYNFWSYDCNAQNNYLQFNCGAKYHYVHGRHTEKTSKRGKRTICGRPSKNLFTEDYGDEFATSISFDGSKIVIVNAGQAEATNLKHLCPICLAKVKKIACQAGSDSIDSHA